MNALLDTCTFLWLIESSDQLSQTVLDIYDDEDSVLYLSSISLWEITMKYAAGKMPLPAPPAEYLPEKRELFGIQPLSLDEQAIFTLPKLSNIHKDPFDRMLISQAVSRGFTILTPDHRFRR